MTCNDVTPVEVVDLNDLDDQKHPERWLTMNAFLQCQQRHEERFEELLRWQQATLLEALLSAPLESEGHRRSGRGQTSTCGMAAELSLTTSPDAVIDHPSEASRSAECSRPLDGSSPAPQQAQSSHKTTKWKAQRFSFSRRTSWTIQPFEDKEKNLRSAAQNVFDSDQKAPGWKPGPLGPMCIRRSALSMTQHKYFETAIVALIVANSIVIGAQADWAVKSSDSSKAPKFFAIVDAIFTVVFFIELLLRCTAEGLAFLSPHRKAFGLNVFDMLVVVLSMVDQVLQAWVSAPGVLAMRLLRLLRIARVLRVIRVFRFFQDLRVLLAGIMASMKSLVWVLLLSTILAFIVGVCIMDFVAERTNPSGEDNAALTSKLLKYYGSLDATLFSLYQAVTGGVDWGNMTDPLLELHPLLCVFFAAYIAIAVLCVLNMITGLFVENAKRLSQRDETQFLMETVNSRREWLDEVKSLFIRVADPLTMRVDVQSFIEHLGDMRVQVNFKKLGIEVEQENAAGLFEMLDLQGDGFVDLDEFALGVQMLHGSARSIDMARLRYLFMGMERQISGLVDSVKQVSIRQRSQSGGPTCEPPIGLGLGPLRTLAAAVKAPDPKTAATLPGIMLEDLEEV